MKDDKYVVGLRFSLDLKNVALIRKLKPTWQAGLLNGIGGKIEDGETSEGAILREFEEETGLQTSIEQWHRFHHMRGTNNDGRAFQIEFFCSIGNLLYLKSPEAEKIEIWEAARIGSGEQNTIGNLPWLVMLAKDFLGGVSHLTFSTSVYRA